MDKKVLIGAVAVFLIGAVLGNFAIKMFLQPSASELAAAEKTTSSLIGTTLPGYSMLDIDGVRENSSQWLGKVQIINFWATWCPPCTREIPTLIQLQNDYRNRGLQVVGIATLDDAETVRQYVRENSMNYPVLIGNDDAVDISIQLGNEMGMLPYTVIADQTGKISFIRFGEVDRKTVENEINKLL